MWEGALDGLITLAKVGIAAVIVLALLFIACIGYGSYLVITRLL